MRFEPLIDMVVIQTVIAPEKTEGGIVLPDSARQKPDEGIILSLGPDAKDHGVEEGDRVIFGKYVGLELSIPGMQDNVLLIHISDIYGRLVK
jgi:chaperonin GroES